MRMLKISALEGVISTFELSDDDNPMYGGHYGSWEGYVELVNLPVVFPDGSQLIGLVYELGAIDPSSIPNPLATQLYRFNGELVHQGNQPVCLWDDVYLASMNTSDPEANLMSIPDPYGPEQFAHVIAQRINTTDHWLVLK